MGKPAGALLGSVGDTISGGIIVSARRTPHHIQIPLPPATNRACRSGKQTSAKRRTIGARELRALLTYKVLDLNLLTIHRAYLPLEPGIRVSGAGLYATSQDGLEKASTWPFSEGRRFQRWDTRTYHDPMDLRLD